MASGVGAWKLVLPASTATQQFRQTTFGTSDQVRDRAANRNGTGSTSMTTPCAADLRMRSLCFWPLSAPTRSNDTSGQSGERVSAPTSPRHGTARPGHPVRYSTLVPSIMLLVRYFHFRDLSYRTGWPGRAAPWRGGARL